MALETVNSGSIDANVTAAHKQRTQDGEGGRGIEEAVDNWAAVMK